MNQMPRIRFVLVVEFTWNGIMGLSGKLWLFVRVEEAIISIGCTESLTID